jgi:hypothetical protein
VIELAKVNAKNGVVEIMVGGTATPLGEVKSWSIDTQMGTIDVSTISSTFKEFLVGQASWSGSLEVFYDPDDAAQQQLADDAIAGEEIEIHIYPNGKGDGKPKLSGNMLITSWSPAGAVEDAVGLSLSFQGSAALTNTTVGTTHTITVTAGDNGTCSPVGSVPVVDGANKAIQVTASDGYEILTLTVGGVEVADAVGKTEYIYTVMNVSANIAVAATFTETL